jgi:tRNA(His) 5'-end guanylyltransferase
MTNLYSRLQEFEQRQQPKLLPKLPLIIKINGRNFYKLTQNLEKPYHEIFANCFHETLRRLCMEIEGASFGYTYNDQILIVCMKPEDTPWYDNDVQKINSVVASLTTSFFIQHLLSYDIDINLDIAFLVSVFVLPTLDDAINLIIGSQVECIKLATYFSCFYSFLERGFNKDEIENSLYNLTIGEKEILLKEKLDIDYEQYPLSFRLGCACYRVQKNINDTVKLKWTLIKDSYLFAEELETLENILKGCYE